MDLDLNPARGQPELAGRNPGVDGAAKSLGEVRRKLVQRRPRPLAGLHMAAREEEDRAVLFPGREKAALGGRLAESGSVSLTANWGLTEAMRRAPVRRFRRRPARVPPLAHVSPGIEFPAR